MTSKTRSRSSANLEENTSKKNLRKVAANQKVFFFDDELLKKSQNLKFELFHHPGKGKRALFIADLKGKNLFEVKEFAEPHRSWLVNKNICSNGKVYFTVPLDCTFLALYYLKKFCSQKAMSLDDIIDEDDPSVHTFLSEYTIREHLEVVADVKTAAGMKFYKYNPTRTLAWLAIKVRNLADCLRRENIYCGFTSLSQNYKKSEAAQTTDDLDYLRNACDIVGDYVDFELHDELRNYLGINELESKAAKAASKKRKSVNSDENLSKKIKLEDSSSENVDESPSPQPQPVVAAKEKKVTAKEKAMAKGAKGTKSISSFFKK